MAKRKLIAVVVVAALVSVSALAYFTYFSPPFSNKWTSSLGHANVVAGGTASGGGNYYFLSWGGGFIQNNTTVQKFSLQAVNTTSGNTAWNSTITLNTPQDGLLVILSPYTEAAGDMPQIHYWNNELFLFSYFNNLSYDNQHYGYSNGTGFMIASLHPSNGTIQSTSFISQISGNINLSSATIRSSGPTLYMGYQSRDNGTLSLDAAAVGFSNGTVIWKKTTGSYSQSSTVYPSGVYSANGDIGVTELINGSGILYTLSSSTGTTITTHSLSGVSGVAGVIGNNFVYYSGSNGYLEVRTANLTSSSTSDFITDVPFTGISAPSPSVSIVYGEILVSLNSEVRAYSLSGQLLWKNSLEYAASNYYSSGFMESGHNQVLYWSYVSVFTGTNGPPNYRVTYDHFAQFNASTGNIFWQRSYSPATSFVMGEIGTPYQPLFVNGNVLIYQWNAQGGTQVAATHL